MAAMDAALWGPDESLWLDWGPDAKGAELAGDIVSGPRAESRILRQGITTCSETAGLLAAEAAAQSNQKASVGDIRLFIFLVDDNFGL